MYAASFLQHSRRAATDGAEDAREILGACGLLRRPRRVAGRGRRRNQARPPAADAPLSSDISGDDAAVRSPTASPTKSLSISLGAHRARSDAPLVLRRRRRRSRRPTSSSRRRRRSGARPSPLDVPVRGTCATAAAAARSGTTGARSARGLGDLPARQAVRAAHPGRRHDGTRAPLPRRRPAAIRQTLVDARIVHKT